jgi:hypothetical protein
VGQNRCGGNCETTYWQHLAAGASNTTTYDPYFIIDGDNAPTTTYQLCCSTGALKGDRLMVHLIPGMDAVWGDQLTLRYVDRWVRSDLWTQPDPCAPLSQGGGSNGSGGCKLDPDLTPGSIMTSSSVSRAGSAAESPPPRAPTRASPSGDRRAS